MSLRVLTRLDLEDIRRVFREELATAIRSGGSSPTGIDPRGQGDDRCPSPGNLAIALPGPCPSGGYIYFAETAAPNRAVKIGQARNLINRVSSLRNGCPYELWIRAWYWTKYPDDEELAMHGRYAHARIRGEWFAPDADLLRFVEDLADLRSPSAIAERLAKVP